MRSSSSATTLFIANIASLISSVAAKTANKQHQPLSVVSTATFLHRRDHHHRHRNLRRHHHRIPRDYRNRQHRAGIVRPSAIESSSSRIGGGIGIGRMSSDTASSSAADGDDATALLRQRKQSLRNLIRSRMKSAYPRDEAGGQSSRLLSSESDLVFSRLFSLPQYSLARSVGFFLSMPHGEIRTDRAIRRMIASPRGGGGGDGDTGTERKVLYVPRVGLDFEGRDMDMVRCDDVGTATAPTTDDDGSEKMFYHDWPRNRWGIPEPPPSTTTSATAEVATPGDIDILVVPGLAFDVDGSRLGQGKGYYDRFIARMRADDRRAGGEGDDARVTWKRPLLVGVCLEEQFLDEAPHGVDLGHRGGGYPRGGIIPVSDHDYVMDIVLTPSRTLILRNVQS